MKAGSYAIISDVGVTSLLYPQFWRLVGESVFLLEDIHPAGKRAMDVGYCAGRVRVLSGYYTDKEMILGSIKLRVVDLDTEITENRLCTCKSSPYPHKLTYAGCRSEESAPFCGHCGESTTVITQTETDKEEFWGTIVDRITETDISECCACEDLYLNASLTERK